VSIGRLTYSLFSEIDDSIGECFVGDQADA
jgi:hypothetical protein